MNVGTMRTSDTGVVCVEVGDEVCWTGQSSQQGVLRHGHVTLPASGALVVHLSDDVRHAADVVVTCQAAADVHSPVLGVPHQNHGTLGTGSVEVLQLTVLLRTHCANNRRSKQHYYAAVLTAQFSSVREVMFPTLTAEFTNVNAQGSAKQFS